MQTREFIFEKYGKCILSPPGIFTFAILFLPRSCIAKSSKNTQGNNVHGQLTYFSGGILLILGGEMLGCKEGKFMFQQIKANFLCSFPSLPWNKNFCFRHIISCKENKFKTNFFCKEFYFKSHFSFLLSCKK